VFQPLNPKPSLVKPVPSGSAVVVLFTTINLAFEPVPPFELNVIAELPAGIGK
jgi:hypothetical protein